MATVLWGGGVTVASPLVSGLAVKCLGNLLALSVLFRSLLNFYLFLQCALLSVFLHRMQILHHMQCLVLEFLVIEGKRRSNRRQTCWKIRRHTGTFREWHCWLQLVSFSFSNRPGHSTKSHQNPEHGGDTPLRVATANLCWLKSSTLPYQSSRGGPFIYRLLSCCLCGTISGSHSLGHLGGSCRYWIVGLHHHLGPHCWL